MAYVTNRDGRWYAVSYEGLDPLTGRDRRRRHRAGDETAARALADALPSARPPSARGITVSRYLRVRWLPTREARLRPTTAFRYERMIERYVLPHIGRVPLRSLTVTHLEDLYTLLHARGRHDGGPLAPKTVLNVHQILRTTLGDAERAGLVHLNSTSPGSWTRRATVSRRSSTAGTNSSSHSPSRSPSSIGSAQRPG